ncbi:MAG: pyrimidine-nucleoside phosphorylase, partial [Clostridiales bacterium]|nr:pyrimidine-nucleoside phosphorylase [Clostridiales bacterium]
VLDVKYGSGAFFKTTAAAYEAADVMVGIGRAAGQRIAALISSMEQPLGRAVGNALEVEEAWQVLCGQGPSDVRELCLALAARAIDLAGLAADKGDAMVKATELLDNGAARAVFMEMVEAQGGESDLSRLPKAALQISYTAKVPGYICALRAEPVGRAALALGAGRRVKEAGIDHGAGILLQHKAGDHVLAGESIALLHGNDNGGIEEAAAILDQAVIIGREPPKIAPLIDGMV